MLLSLAKTAATVSLLFTLGAEAFNPKLHFIFQTHSENPSFDGQYLVAQKRDPTYGTIFVLDSTTATPVYLGGHGVPHQAMGYPRIAEASYPGGQDSRVYFGRTKYLHGFTPDSYSNVTCTIGSHVRGVKGRPLSCGADDRTSSYACAGDGEESGWFVYSSARGPTDFDADNCALITLSAIRLASSQAADVKLVSLN